MSRFSYRAVGADGLLIEGEMEAPGEAAVIARLQALGHLPLGAERAGGSGSRGLSRALFSRRQVSRKRLVLVMRELATLLGAGLPIERSFEILIDLSEHPATRDLLSRVLEALRGGASLADALAEQDGTFPSLTISLVRAGEAGSALDSVLTRLADHQERAQALADSVRSALVYPAVLVAMTLLSIVVLMTVVMPEFESLFEDAGDALPLATRIMIGVGDLLTGYWWVLAGGLAAVAWVLRRQLAYPAVRLRWDRLLLRLPLMGDLVSKLLVARVCRTLGTLVQNGVTLTAALPIVRDTLDNAALAHALDQVAAQLRAGKGLAAPLAEAGVFPDLAVHLVRVGEETGELPAMLSKAAEIYDREVRSSLEGLVALLVPALTIGLGMIIASIIGSVLLAFLSVNELAL